LHAEKGGHLEVLKWVRENGCRWDEYTRRIAASMGYFEAASEAEEESDDLFSDVDSSELSWSGEDA
jgi:hypothetical protein